ncbi:MAG TPA: hypothetical protein VGP99_11540, partial [Tepidisphaeraceae bacterium]|nr:hypothetical protein [Tepidisphaeraceae bacterium]
MKKAVVKLLSAGIAALGIAAYVNSASANSIYAPAPPTVTPVGSLFKWDYAVVVTQGSQVVSGDAF